MLSKDTKVIYICSPLKGNIVANIQRVRQYCKTILEVGYIPYAPHVAFEGVLDDNSPQEREIALLICVEMVKRCDELWVFGNTISDGMKKEIEAASNEKIPILFFNESTIMSSKKKVSDWIEEQLSEKWYNIFIQELIAEDDYEHPTYEEWRNELEPDITAEAYELKNKGGLK